MAKNYHIQYIVIDRSMSYPAAAAAVGFINQGTCDVTINSAITLIPGASVFPFDVCNSDDFDTTNYNIAFGDTGSKKLVLARKIYQ